MKSLTPEQREEYNNGTRKPEVGMFANRFGYTDINPYEIVEVNETGKTIKVRQMDAERDPSWKPEFVVGGFAGHCVNNSESDQKWVITSNPDNHVLSLRLSKNGFAKGEFWVDNYPRKKYDFNF